MRDGYETHVDRANKLIIQRFWGETSTEIVASATRDLIAAATEIHATRCLELVSESDAVFQPDDLIRSLEQLQAVAPTIRRLAYVLDPERHDVEQMVLATISWNLGIRAGFFSEEDAAREFLLDGAA